MHISIKIYFCQILLGRNLLIVIMADVRSMHLPKLQASQTSDFRLPTIVTKTKSAQDVPRSVSQTIPAVPSPPPPRPPPPPPPPPPPLPPLRSPTQPAQIKTSTTSSSERPDSSTQLEAVGPRILPLPIGVFSYLADLLLQVSWHHINGSHCLFVFWKSIHPLWTVVFKRTNKEFLPKTDYVPVVIKLCSYFLLSTVEHWTCSMSYVACWLMTTTDASRAALLASIRNPSIQLRKVCSFLYSLVFPRQCSSLPILMQLMYILSWLVFRQSCYFQHK